MYACCCSLCVFTCVSATVSLLVLMWGNRKFSSYEYLSEVCLESCIECPFGICSINIGRDDFTPKKTLASHKHCCPCVCQEISNKANSYHLIKSTPEVLTDIYECSCVKLIGKKESLLSWVMLIFFFHINPSSWWRLKLHTQQREGGRTENWLFFFCWPGA